MLFEPSASRPSEPVPALPSPARPPTRRAAPAPGVPRDPGPQPGPTAEPRAVGRQPRADFAGAGAQEGDTPGRDILGAVGFDGDPLGRPDPGRQLPGQFPSQFPGRIPGQLPPAALPLLLASLDSGSDGAEVFDVGAFGPAPFGPAPSTTGPVGAGPAGPFGAAGFPGDDPFADGAPVDFAARSGPFGLLGSIDARARRRALRAGDQEVDTGHLLHALLETDSRALAVAADQPAQQARLLGYLAQRGIGFGRRWFGTEGGPAEDDRHGPVHRSRAVDRALRRAPLRAALRSAELGGAEAGCDALDLLAELAATRDCRAAEILRGAGIDPDDVVRRASRPDHG